MSFAEMVHCQSDSGGGTEETPLTPSSRVVCGVSMGERHERCPAVAPVICAILTRVQSAASAQRL